MTDFTLTVPYTLFQDRCHPPEQTVGGQPKTGDRCFYGLNTLGGGMFQTVWTTVTGSLVLYHLYCTGYRVNLLGRGDNQVALVDLTKGEDPSCTGKCSFWIEVYVRGE